MLFLFRTHVDVEGSLILEVLPTELANHLLPHAMEAIQVILDCIWSLEHASTDRTHQGICAVTLSYMPYKP